MTAVALVVAEPGRSLGELEPALVGCGYEVLRVAPADLPGRPELVELPEVVLAAASLGLQRVALLAQRFARGRRRPAVLVFGLDDWELLEACVRGGFDWVAPPFLPSLLRSRIVPPAERSQLAGTVTEMAAEATLRSYERELNIAHEIQAGFLPERLPTRAGWDVGFRFRPATEVAGDFYDGFELVGGHRLGFVVADVCDKGVSAALFMALIRTLLRHTAEQTGSWTLMDEVPDIRPLGSDRSTASVPAQLSIGAGPLVQAVAGTNRYLTRNHLRQGYFVTLFFAVLDPRTGGLLYINGGHNPPVLVRAGGEQLLLQPTGPAVGLMPDSTYLLGHAVLEPGDTLFAYTDGVVESQDAAGTLFGLPRLLDVLGRPAESAEAMLAAVDLALAGHAGEVADQFDDITMLALRRG